MRVRGKIRQKGERILTGEEKEEGVEGMCPPPRVEQEFSYLLSSASDKA